MAQVNYGVDEAADFETDPTIAVGKHLIECIEVTTRTTKAGDEQWSLKLEIIHGSDKGKMARDAIFFTEKAMPRVKLVCHRLGGIEGSGHIDVQPNQLLNRKSYITIVAEEKEEFGETKTTKRVAYGGYTSIGDDIPEDVDPKDEHAKADAQTETREDEKKSKSEDDLPF